MTDAPAKLNPEKVERELLLNLSDENNRWNKMAIESKKVEAAKVAILPDNPTGRELIAWAVEMCRRENIPPHDGRILIFIREWKPNGR